MQEKIRVEVTRTLSCHNFMLIDDKTGFTLEGSGQVPFWSSM